MDSDPEIQHFKDVYKDMLPAGGGAGRLVQSGHAGWLPIDQPAGPPLLARLNGAQAVSSYPCGQEESFLLVLCESDL